MRTTRDAPSGSTSGLALLLVLAGELKRAVAAEQRYQDLKRSGATAPSADLPRLVFDEFYSLEETAEPRRRGINRSRWGVGRQSTSLARQVPMLATTVVGVSPACPAQRSGVRKG